MPECGNKSCAAYGKLTAWKEKVMKGEIKAEDATKALDEYKAKLAEAQDQIVAFQSAFDSSKAECTSSCDEAKSCCEKK